MPTFRWGGRTWGPGNKKAFKKHLARRGIRWEDWVTQHADAAKDAFGAVDPIDAQINAALGPEISAAQQERKERRAYYERMQGRQKDVALALGEMLSAIAPQTEGLFNRARDSAAALGRGFGGATADVMANMAAEDNAFLGRVADAPQAQLDARTATAGGAGLADIIHGLGGYIPGQALNSAGAGFTAAALQLPYFAGERAKSNVKALTGQALEEDERFGAEIKALRSKRGGLRAELRDQKLKEIEERRRYELEKAEDRRRWEEEQKMRQEALEAQLESLGIRVNSSSGLDAAGDPKPGYHIDPVSGKLVKDGWHHVKKGGRWVPKKDKSPTSKGGLTQAEKDARDAAEDRAAAVKRRESAIRDATENIYADATEMAAPDAKANALAGRPLDARPPRRAIRKKLITKYMRILGGFAGKSGKGALRRRVTKIVDEALNSVYT